MKCTGAWGGVTVVRKCNSHQGGVKGIPNKSKVLGAPWIFFKFLESARFVSFFL